MIVLDADSLMSGRAMRRLAQLMRSNPRLGILQTLVVGLPADRPFARIFQFGMRNGMRPYTVGSAWWQGDCGPYWGHNAIIRLAPFRQHCRLPRLPGEPPLGGDILSHDQVEAVLMRRAGYEVRVLPEEDGSFEENPPTLPDFMQRDLRWCQGNMQYLHHQLIGMPGLHLLGRVQLLLAILMYAAAPAWLGLLALGLFALCLPASLPADGAPAALPPAPGGVSLGLILFAATLLLSYIQKWLSVLDVLLRPQARRSAGGWGRILVATAIEAVFSVLLSPVLAVAQTMFIGGLAFGRTIRWSAQSRQGRTVPLLEALRGLWPQTVAGSLVFAVLALRAPELLPWAAPVIAGLVLAVPFASVTASARLGGLMKRYRICATPEELAVGEAAEPVAAAAASFLSAQERVVAAAETEGGRT
jgi:membrane glycosyltransferase